jgi:hypothetical protein
LIWHTKSIDIASSQLYVEANLELYFYIIKKRHERFIKENVKSNMAVINPFFRLPLFPRSNGRYIYCLGDTISQERIYLFGFAVFHLGSLACAFAPSLLTLIVARTGDAPRRCFDLPSTMRRVEYLGFWVRVLQDETQAFDSSLTARYRCLLLCARAMTRTKPR